MQYLDGTCTWDDYKDHFTIERHALQIHTPVNGNGDVDCVAPDGTRKFPKLDYSKGFPDWWLLSRTDIYLPSNHVQEGHRYAAEVVLAHFYEIDMYKNKLGLVSIFLQDYEGEPAWPYLDKLICQWRKVEEAKRAACGLDPAPVYKLCELFRGQQRTEADLNESPASSEFPTEAPLLAPDPIPVKSFGSNPELSHFPLQMCQGNCNYDSDCALGLLCSQREAFQAVFNCLDGELDGQATRYCVFDPYGVGYTPAASDPTLAPTSAEKLKWITNRGWTPIDILNECEGDCDNDTDCAPGLGCFQRDAYNISVPGCLGGETEATLTDYCVQLSYLNESRSDPASASAIIKQVSASSAVPSKLPFDSQSLPPSNSPSATSSDAPSASPSKKPSAQSVGGENESPTAQSKALNLTNLGWMPKLPLGVCQGDCDVDSDCQPGLRCFQRDFPNQTVPGCKGGENESTLTDYCVVNETMDQGKSAATRSEPQVLLPPINCTAYDANYLRMCKDESCCSDPRSSSSFCHSQYSILGDVVESACHYCCLEEIGLARTIGPAAAENPNIAKTIACDEATTAFRMCKDGSCCDEAGSTTSWCREQYASFPSDIESICVSNCVVSNIFRDACAQNSPLFLSY